MIKKLRVTVDGKQYEVTVELEDEPSGQPVFAPVAAPPPVLASSASSSPAVSSTVSIPSAAAAPAASAAGPGDVPSPLAGRVAAINVQVGQSVKEGDHLLTLEAMKMNTFVMAPRAGKVKEVKVTVGAAVEEGQAVVSLEPV